MLELNSASPSRSLCGRSRARRHDQDASSVCGRAGRRSSPDQTGDSALGPSRAGTVKLPTALAYRAARRSTKGLITVTPDFDHDHGLAAGSRRCDHGAGRSGRKYCEDLSADQMAQVPGCTPTAVALRAPERTFGIGPRRRRSSLGRAVAGGRGRSGTCHARRRGSATRSGNARTSREHA
jgi:hypothetical protein